MKLYSPPPHYFLVKLLWIYNDTSYFIKRAVKRSISVLTENWSVSEISLDNDDSFINFSASSSDILSSNSNSTNGKISVIFQILL